MARINHQRECQAMGTRFEVWLSGDDEEHLEAVANSVIEEILRLDILLSRFDSRSEVARINRLAGIRSVQVDHELFALLQRCYQAWELTEGYFDVMRGNGSLLLDAATSTVQINQASAIVDLGGIGKGYALDRAREILQRFGVTQALFNAGTSSVLALAGPAGGKGWPIDLRHPIMPKAEVAARLILQQQALSCSAVRHYDQISSDLINPLTGQPLCGEAACIVIAASATDAEIFSTALLAMGRPQAIRYLTNQPQLDLIVGWVDAAQLTAPAAELSWIAGAAHGLLRSG